MSQHAVHRGFSAAIKNRLLQHAKGNASLMTVGLIIFSTLLGVLVVDLPIYFVYQNQLQTAVDAAALAGAAQLPLGQAQAEEAAIEFAGENKVAGQTVTEDNLSFIYTQGSQMTMSVKGEIDGPTIFAKLVCGFKNGNFGSEEGSGEADQHCDFMKVTAWAKAIPSARDTMIVIDNSSSMHFLGNQRPLKDVKSAAVDYVDQVLDLDINTADRIGFVKFAYDGTKVKSLKSQSEDTNFNSLKSSLNNLTIYNAQGWNTNYEAGLKLGVEELINNGRPNANKVIIFLTDGMPNLPAPANYYNYSYYQPYNKCIDPVHNAVKTTYKTQACTYDSKSKKWTCPTLPSSKIKDYMISSSAQSCGEDYVDYMTERVHYWSDMAAEHDITIHVISIAEDDAEESDNASSILRRLIKDPSWNPEETILDYIADSTEGMAFKDDTYDPAVISSIYTDIAKDVRVRLAE